MDKTCPNYITAQQGAWRRCAPAQNPHRNSLIAVRGKYWQRLEVCKLLGTFFRG